jgi:hypothetical protein
MHQWRTAGLAGAVLAILASAGSAAAEPVTDFFTGKQITMIVPSGVGGGYESTTGPSRFRPAFPEIACACSAMRLPTR